ncbi:metallophosphoesterase [Galbibacter sp. EGI 63066]|uniref:metallophosphoesterase n=1 Tax=Galbibacter sp. EGI 63066 TaxID=2993559 RepID=UPI0022495B66|nr:metallophosphoesterase [Galbibacter sp. EGI 63066]MCX2679735.1 metallophosphoesterase [Galbibacter sp. EGI 63066]
MYKYFPITLIIFFFSSCATYQPQYSENTGSQLFPESKEIVHSFYLIGDGGNSPIGTSTKALQTLNEDLNKASENSTLLFLGDNIYPKGLPKKDNKGRAFAEHQLNEQTAVANDYKGQSIFIPGNHDWYSGLKGLKRQEKYVEDKLGKDAFLPEDGCPLERVKITDDIVLIIVDSEWYLTDWDKHPTINDDCEIKTRDKFLEELEGEIKKARGKTTVIALHHPMYSNGPHAGQYSFMSYMKPLPVLGSLKNLIRKTGGVVNVDMQNARYRELTNHLTTLAQQNDKTILVSGHEHNLQYLLENNLPQIISGSGSKLTATRNQNNGKFSYGAPGYARLDVFTDGSSFVRFYTAKDHKVVFQTEIFQQEEPRSQSYPDEFPEQQMAGVYTKEETTKGGLHKLLWGERYRNYYSTKIKAPTVDLDSLLGGLTPVRKGGGHQSKTLRLEDDEGREYMMRALRKQAIQYLQTGVFKDQYIEDEFKDTYTEDLVLDVFTGAYPYAPFALTPLSEAIGVYHTKPELYYVPKQNALGGFNDDFGNELYMIEERPADGHGDKSNFGFSDEIVSTDDMFEDVLKDEDNIVDEKAYIRARLFDMLIGDWDRHEDQWRWAVFEEDGQTIYRPVPRDRDQAFSVMSDGLLMGIGNLLFPSTRLLEAYDKDLKRPEWFNTEPYPLDLFIIDQAGKDIWDDEVKHIQTHITDSVIEKAFSNIPEELKDETIDEIKQKLKGRRDRLPSISDAYFAHINKFSIVKGTNKDDWFDIERLPNGKTEITAFRIKKGEKSDVFFHRIFSKKETKEIWVYALDDDDVFHVFGQGSDPIKIRLVGGQNNDTYNIINGKRLRFYDYKSKKNDVVSGKQHGRLTDNYKINVYNHKKVKKKVNQILPAIGYNPDDGVKLGVQNIHTRHGFKQNPFTARHAISAAYYFATSGYDLMYKGEFANIVGAANLAVDLRFTSPNYAVNFFGFGNESVNPNDVDDDLFDMDYNRVRLKTFLAAPSLVWRGDYGSRFQVGASYETNQVERTTGRFIATFPEEEGFFSAQDFYGINMSYQYKNQDDKSFPTLGMLFKLETGYKNSIKTSDGYGYIIPELGFDYRLVPEGQLVLASKLAGQVNLGDDFEFYQAAQLGANSGLRGYRRERFTGDKSFVQSTDLRWSFSRLKTGLFPINIGLYGGFDYGRVWMDDDVSKKWHNAVGGGVFMYSLQMFSGNLSVFNSTEGFRFAFRLGFDF